MEFTPHLGLDSHEHIEVYNKAFRNHNLQQDMQGVFTIGSATIDDINELERLKEDLVQKKNEWESYCNSFRKKADEEKPARELQFMNRRKRINAIAAILLALPTYAYAAGPQWYLKNADIMKSAYRARKKLLTEWWQIHLTTHNESQ